jgi:O-antigen/teichoic acid export membrane protein
VSASSSTVEAPNASRQLLLGAYSLAANTGITSVLGMGFWLIAARLYSNVDVGRDAALISVMIELSTLCQLNLNNGIIRFLPDLGERSGRAVGAAYGLTGALALLVGSVFVFTAPRVSHELAFLGNDLTLKVGFVAALVLWGVFALQDAALTATRRASWVPVENGLFGVLKIAALPILLVAGVSNGIFAAWVLPMALLLVPVNVLIFRRAIPEHVASEERESSVSRLGVGRVMRFLAQDYVASVFTQATLTLLPLLVIAILGPKASAYFAIPFMIVMAFDTLAYSACTSLVVETTLAGEHLHPLVRLFVRRVLVLLVPAGLLLIAAAPLVLLPFGRAYTENGTGVLRLLLCASLLRAGIALFSAISRIGGHGLRLAAVEFTLLVLVLGLAVPLAHSHGIDGVAVAWLGANLLISLAILPWLVRFLRAPQVLEGEP